MYELPMNVMMSALVPTHAMPVEVEAFNAAELDVGYEVAFPFLAAVDDADN